MRDKELIRDMLDKINGTLNEDWQSIADRFGVGFHADTLRKAALGVKMADQAGILSFDGVKPQTDESYQVELEALYKERCKLRDERTALNKRLRDEARLENKFERMEDLISKYAVERYGFSKCEGCKHDASRTNSMIAVVSDVHYGLSFSDGVCVYNNSIAEARMSKYTERIIQEGKKHLVKDLTIVFLGDLISGSIHKTVQLQNTDNVLDQIIGCSKLMTDFVYSLSDEFDHIYIYGVGGNHSRIDTKDDALNDERLDNLILWFLETALRPQKNVVVYCGRQDKGSTVCEFSVANYLCCVGVHGDYDEFSSAGLAKLSSYLGYTPDLVLSGHKHEFACMSVNNTMMVRNGCICGSGDNFTEKNRLTCIPSQTIIIVGKSGTIEDIIPVWFKYGDGSSPSEY